MSDNRNTALTVILLAFVVFAAASWLLTIDTASGCSIAGQMGGGSCMPLAAQVHGAAGWFAVGSLCVAVISHLTGRTR